MDTAICIVCNKDKPVCCDQATRDLPDGTREHDDPVCADCCGPHPRPMVGVGSYERMDCDV